MSEWQAAAYSQHSSLQQAMADEILHQLSLAGTERVLDVGCGDGKITAAIADRLPRGSVVGVDPSRDMIDFARARHAMPPRANLRFEVGDALHLPAEGEFDLVLSFNALHWVAQQQAALQAMRAVLRPGGEARLRFVPAGPRESLEDVIEAVRQLPTWSEHFAGFQPPYYHVDVAAYRRLAQAAGFAVRSLTVDDKAWDFRTRQGFVAFAQATFVAWTSRLPESERLAFINQVLDRYQQVAADTPAEAHTFKFYQMTALLTARAT